MKRCLRKECCKQYRYVKFKGTMTKWPVQKPTHRTMQNYSLRFSDYSILFSFLYIVSEIISARNVITFYFFLAKFVLSCWHFLKENKKNNINNYKHMQYALRCRFYPQSMNGQARERSRLLKELPLSQVVWHTEDTVW